MSTSTITSDRYNLGCGDTPIEGWHNWDRATGQECYPLDVPDNSADEIRASHVLEHLPPDEVEKAILDWARALKPGGRLRIAVPDFRYWADQYLNHNRMDVTGHVMGGHQHADDIHHSLFDARSLRVYLLRAGLVCIDRWVDEVGDCASNPGSLNLEAYKPTPDVAEYGTVKGLWAVLSTGRLVFSDFMESTYRTLAPLNVPMISNRGGNWGQAMERGFEDAIANGAEWILALDYDSVWDDRTLHRLCMIVENDPTIDALAAMQCKREEDTVLMNGVSATTWDEFESEAVDVKMAHFGLTLIRTSALKAMPKPWFRHEPNADGTWRDGKIDDDVNFWVKLRASGGRVCVAPRVSVGHCQLMVTWPGEDLKPVHQYISGWRTSGKPANAR